METLAPARARSLADEELYGDFIESMDRWLPWDGESKYFVHWWTVEGNRSGVAGDDCAIAECLRWFSEGALNLPGVGPARLFRGGRRR